MRYFDEIAKIARELYRKNAGTDAPDLESWLEAERLVMGLQYELNEKGAGENQVRCMK
jgi:hypothetical protein